jgi:hypothetical protein
MTLKAFDNRPWLIVCEGESDKRFLNQLIQVRAIPNEFQVRCPGREPDNRGGRSKIGPWLDAARGATGWDNIYGVLLISDNDDNPAASFDEVRASLTAGQWKAIPAAERTVATGVDLYVDTVILMLPPGQAGSLETLCLTAAYSKWQNIKIPLDTFVQAVGVNVWSANREAKMRLASLIAATCNARPDTGFVGHWWEDARYHVPLNEPVFDDLADFLRGFSALIAAA